MKLTGKIAGDLKVFHRPTSLQKSRGILRIWIMVLGEGSARFFEVTEKSIDAIGHAVSLEGLAISPQQESAFYLKLAKWLHDALDENLFDRLFVVAPEKLLDSLRTLITRPVACCIAGEAKQDFSTLHGAALEKELKKVVWA